MKVVRIIVMPLLFALNLTFAYQNIDALNVTVEY